ncbi:MAG: HAMP domain-containing histidine kinase [Bacteroidia bacterium]|nr:HAMP domain-containing histidine kinase [Bacteroidia bacterium]
MKLLTRTTIYYFISTLLVFSIGTVIFFYSLRKILDEEVNEGLQTKKTELQLYFSKTEVLPEVWPPGTGILSISKYRGTFNDVNRDTLYLNTVEGEILPYRLLQFSTQVNKENYSVLISQPLIESEDLLEAIIFSLIILFVITIILMILINRVISKKIWRTFYETLSTLKKFDLKNSGSLKFSKTGIREFKELNEALSLLTEKISSDFRNMKEFTENASHELQTPLAVISAKLELLIQSSGLTEEQANSIRVCYESANKLAKINSSLLLVSRIENRQFNNEEKTDLSEMLQLKLKSFSELFELNGLKVENKIETKNIQIPLPAALSEILLNNLLGNALKHTEKGGLVFIALSTHKLSVANTGKPLDVPATEIFKRFARSSKSANSNGLGLSILKKICDTYNLKPTYLYRDGKHFFEVEF